MSNRNAKIQIKHSNVIGAVPSSTFLEYGELALNYADEKIYYKDSTGAIRAYGTLAGDVTGPTTSNTILNTVVTGKTLANYSSMVGTIGTGDTILSAIGKLNGNTALKAPIDGPLFTTSIGLQYNGSTNRLNLANDATVQWLRNDSGSIQRTDTLSPATVTTSNRTWTLPSTSGTLATTAYVDAYAQGLHVHQSVHVILKTSLETLTGGTVTYTNGTNGVGAKLTLSVALTTAMLDGDTDISLGARIIVAGQTNAALNGIYTYSTATELIRAADFDEPVEAAGGDFVFVTHGTQYANTGWVLSEAVTNISSTGSPFNFLQFSGAGTFTAGNGLTLTNGTEFNVNSTTLTIGADAVNLTAGIITTPGTYKSVTVDTYGRVTAGTNPTTLAGYGITDAVNAVAEIVPISANTAFSEASNAKIFHVSNAVTLTLPSAATVSNGWSIGIVNIGGSTITINRVGSDTINGTLTTFNNTIPYSAVYIYKSSSIAYVAIGILY